MEKKIAYGVLILALFGLLDASLVAWGHYSGAVLRCVGFDGCDKVLSSEYAVLFGLPVALWGMMYYSAILFLTLVYILEKSRGAFTLALIMAAVGLAFSAYFVYLQVFVIKALCFYCIASAADTLTIFSLGVLARLKVII